MKGPLYHVGPKGLTSLWPGMKAGGFTLAGADFAPYYKVWPIFFSLFTTEGYAEFDPSKVIYEVDFESLDPALLVADLPTLVDEGMYYDGDTGMAWWEEGEEPPSLSRYLKDGEIKLSKLIKLWEPAMAITQTVGYMGEIKAIKPVRIIETFTTTKQRFAQQGVDAKEVDDLFAQFKIMRDKGILKGKERDIDTFWSIQSLRDVVYATQEPTGTELRKAAKTGAKKVYEDSEKTVYLITTYEASMYYGKGTKWCISGGKYGGGHWDEMTKGITFYFILSKTRPSSDPLYKVAVGVDEKGIYDLWDATDESLVDDSNINWEDVYVSLGFTVDQFKRLFVYRPQTVATTEAKAREVLTPEQIERGSKVLVTWREGDVEHGTVYIVRRHRDQVLHLLPASSKDGNTPTLQLAYNSDPEAEKYYGHHGWFDITKGNNFRVEKALTWVYPLDAQTKKESVIRIEDLMNRVIRDGMETEAAIAMSLR